MSDPQSLPIPPPIYLMFLLLPLLVLPPVVQLANQRHVLPPPLALHLLRVQQLLLLLHLGQVRLQPNESIFVNSCKGRTGSEMIGK